MSPRPILLRLIGPFAVLIVLVVGMCAGVVWWAGQRTVRLQQIQDLDRLSVLVRQHIGENAAEISPQQLEEIRTLGQVLGTRITLIDGSGKVLADTYADAATMENHNGRPEVMEARKTGTGNSVRTSVTIHQEAVYVAKLVDPKRPEGLVVRLSYPRDAWAELGLSVGSIVLVGTVAALLLMAGLALVLQQRWIGPIRELSFAADRISDGDWQARVEPRGADELRSLGSRFNFMAGQAQHQLSDLRHQRADLRALVDSLPDPVLLGDSENRIILINTPAAELLQVSPAAALGQKMDRAVNEEPILKVVEDARAGAPVIRELRLQRGGQRVTYQAVATASQAGGVLLVLRNISALAMTMQMKTDFVANASHELRTPIAAIKMAFETLQEVYTDDPPQGAKCITIIEGHLRRLEEMLTDLLDLSRVESTDLQPQISTIKIDDLFAFVRSSVGTMASVKEVEMELASSPDLIEFTGDRHLLELVLKNLVENSLKFTPPGGKVTVSFTSQDDQVILEVIDTGIGIPPEHQERVFERFYQVDHVRSGAAGRGTGLGLAIVKHAVHALGGTVKLTSAVGVGTKVRCTLPQVADGAASASVVASNA